MRVPQVSERIKEAPAQVLRGVFAGIGQLLLITDKLRNKTPAGQDVPRARTPEPSETVTDATVTNPAGQREETAAAPAGPVAAEPAPAEPALAEPVAAEAAPAKPAAAKPATAKRTPAAAKPASAKPAVAKPAPARRAAAKPAPAQPASAEPPKPPKPQSTRDFDKTGNVRLLGGDEGSPLDATGSGSTAPSVSAEPVTAPKPVSAAAAEPVSAAAAAPVSAPEPEGKPADSAPPLPNYDKLSVASLRARLRNLDVAQVRQLADYERAHAARADVLTMFERRIAKLEAGA